MSKSRQQLVVCIHNHPADCFVAISLPAGVERAVIEAA